MLKRNFFASSLLLASLLLLLILSRPAAAQRGPAVPAVSGVIGTKWRALGGTTGPLGNPIGPEIDAPEGAGRQQSFEHGTIGFTPATGPNSAQALYLDHQRLVLDWSDTAPFNYDFFLVRWDLDGKNIGQQEVSTSRTAGTWSIHLGTAGRYRVVVEGADRVNGGTRARQGWSNPLYLDFTPPGPDYIAVKPQPQSVLIAAPAAKGGLSGVILAEWMRLGGPAGPMGQPTSPMLAPNTAGVVQFQNGAISFNPNVWENGVMAAYQSGDRFTVDWCVSWGDPNPPSHFSYDKFLIRTEFNHRLKSDEDQVEQKENDDTHLRTRGLYYAPIKYGSGDYTIDVEGADDSLGRTIARQGWLPAITLHVGAAAPNYDLFGAPALLHRTAGQVVTNRAGSQSNGPTTVLTPLPPASSVANAKAEFDRRAAAAVLYCACQPLPPSNYTSEETWGSRALAKLAYADYFTPRAAPGKDYLPGRNYSAREEAIESLRRQSIGSYVGTTSPEPKRTGEYDVVLTHLIPIVYKYYSVLPPDVQNHVIDLLDKRGPFDPADAFPYGTSIPVPETENHLNMIEAARYLTNQLLYLREGDPKYDNARNGMDDWWLERLQHFLKTDFIEYNARPYQDYSMSALLNLYSFADRRNPSSLRVKVAAEMVLDYLMAKMAVSSNDARRAVTFRRHAEDYNDPDFLGWRTDPQVPFLMTYAGTTELVSRNGIFPANFSWEMLWAGLLDYRVPDEILDLMVERPHRDFMQQFHHYADEAYAASPSYLISSGGHFATAAYKFSGTVGKHDDIGLPLPTTFMPTGQFTNRNDLIRFEGDSREDHRSNMGVDLNFACGTNLVIPQSYHNDNAVSADADGRLTAHGIVSEPWTFIAETGNRNGRYTTGADPFGYYLAIYHRDGFGMLEAYDTTNRPKLEFSDFIKEVLKNNPARISNAFTLKGQNTYTQIGGRKIEFELSPDSLVLHPGQKPFFLTGTVLNSALDSAYVTIDNYYLHQRLILDMRDSRSPKLLTEHLAGSLIAGQHIMDNPNNKPPETPTGTLSTRPARGILDRPETPVTPPTTTSPRPPRLPLRP